MPSITKNDSADKNMSDEEKQSIRKFSLNYVHLNDAGAEHLRCVSSKDFLLDVEVIYQYIVGKIILDTELMDVPSQEEADQEEVAIPHGNEEITSYPMGNGKNSTPDQAIPQEKL